MNTETFTHYGTVVHGTLLLEDIIPPCLRTLEEIDRDAYIELVCDYPRQAQFLSATDRKAFRPSMLDGMDDMLRDLFDLLNERAPEGFYFGSHVGDAADFGFWPSED